MNAHDQLERQLRSVVGAATSGRRRRPGVRAVLAAGTIAVTVVVVAVVVLTVRSGSPSTAPVDDAPTWVGPPPPKPGRPSSEVNLVAVNRAQQQAWKADPACEPFGGLRHPTLSSGTPDAVFGATLPALRTPAEPEDPLPGELYSGHQLPAGSLGGGIVYTRYVHRARIGITTFIVPVADAGVAPMPAATGERCERQEVAALARAVRRLPEDQWAATQRWGDLDITYERYLDESRSIQDEVYFLDEGHAHTSRPFGYFESQGVALSTIAQTGWLTQAHGGLGGGMGSTDGVPDDEAVPLMTGIVPGAVASVTLRFPATRHLRALSVTATVTDNMFVADVPTLYQRGGWPKDEVWISSSGTVIKTVNERPYGP